MAEITTAIVAGASSGVGAATAFVLADMGMDLALVARRRDRLEELAAKIEERGGRAFVIPADLADPAASRRAMEGAQRSLAHVDALVNCHGTNVPRRGLAELTVENWDRLIAVNLSSVFYCVHAILPAMRARGGGLIISVSSLAGLRPSTLSGAGYSAAKSGLNMLSGCINAEEAGNGIRSCIIAPGDIDTELLERRPRQPTPQERARMLQPEDVAALIASVIRQPERALVEEIVVRPRPVS